ncbi:MAG: hypothetical protein JXQ87_01935 [Bacteroidia bacterium]
MPDAYALSYFGELGIYPGFRVSCFYELGASTKQKRKGKSIEKRNYLVPSIANYGIIGGQKNWLFGADFERMRFHKKGRRYRLYQVGAFLNMHTNPGNTYSSQNGVFEQGLSARWYFVPKVAFGAGRSAISLGNTAFDIALMPTFYIKMPYNNMAGLPSFALELRLKMI